MVARNRSDESKPYIDAALSSLRAMGGAGEIQAAVTSTLFWSLMLHMGAAPYDKAKAEIEQNRVLLAAHASAIPPVVSATLDAELAWALIQRGELSEARRLMNPSGSIVKEASSQDWRTRSNVIQSEAVLAMMVGEHVAADSLLREGLALAQKGRVGDSAFAVYDWAWLALNLLLKGDHGDAEQVLEGAPKFGDLKGDPTANGRAYATVLPALSARLLLERGDIRDAFSAMPALPADLTDDEPLYALRALGGEVLCAAGRGAEGLPVILASIRSISARVSDKHPGLARIHAAAGLCALSLGDVAQATTLAEQARRAFIAQPEVSPYFKAPLAKLERALQTRRHGS
jgi:tetratricopeptide (TPR) repeat protein